MNLLPKSSGEFASASYWEKFFKKRGQKAFEWYGEYPELCGTLHKYIKSSDTVLHVGCGNSALGASLYDVGYKHITNIDLSATVVKNMKQQHEKKRPGLEFVEMDICETPFEDGSFHAVLDKGTLDAIFTDSKEETLATIDKMFAEIGRVLRVGGRYVCVSLAQEHILRKVVDYFPKQGWMTRICYIAQADREEQQDFHMPVFAFVFTKFKPLPNMTPVMEIAPFEDSVDRVGGAQELIDAVNQLQNYGMVKQQLNKGTSDLEEHLSLDLHTASSNQPKYTLYIVDSSKPMKQKFAIFIVPLGRESEFLFSEKTGREQLLSQAGFQRLLVVILNRAHEYPSLEDVKAELSSKVMELAPEKINQKQVPFLSIGDDLSVRTVQFEGQSTLYGDYVVEDVQSDVYTYRRLIFIKNPMCIADQVSLVKEGSKKKKKRAGGKLVPNDRLTLGRHVTMLAGLGLVEGIHEKMGDQLNVLILGLGGGVLPSYIHRHCPKAQVSIVTQDDSLVSVATEWFGFKQDDRLSVNVSEPDAFIQQLIEKGTKHHAVIVDTQSEQSQTDSNTSSAYLEKSFLQKVNQTLEPSGVFILYASAKKSSQIEDTIKQLRTVFSAVYSKQLSSSSKQVLFALQSARNIENTDVISESAITDVFKNNLVQLGKNLSTEKQSDLDLIEAMEGLTLC